MRRPLSLALGAALLLGAACRNDAPATGAEGPWTAKVTAGVPLTATFKTSLGEVKVRLFSKEAPRTVKNFVGLATGEREWKNPATGQQMKGTPLYKGLIFHRVIEGFMIQGGDPLGTGTGSPGYTFEDEFQSGKTFDKPGLLAMANAGPNTNGSQFFITTSTPAHLNNRHTIFGEVVQGYDVVEAISRVPKDRMDRPLTPVVLQDVVISDS